MSLEAAVVCQRGHTERNSRFVKALFGDAPALNRVPRLYPLGGLRKDGKEVDVPGRRKEKLFNELGDTVRKILEKGYPLYRDKKYRKKPDVVIVIWDSDCYENLEGLKRKICSHVPEHYRDKVCVYFAHPEPEIWLLADWDNSFGRRFFSTKKNADNLKKELVRKGIHFEDLERGLVYDKRRKTCVRKISAVLKSAVKNVAKTRYSKPSDTPRLMEGLDWAKVAGSLPAFRPLYEDWLRKDVGMGQEGRCITI